MNSEKHKPQVNSAKNNNQIAIASGKGGVGKTWFSITLSQTLAKHLLFLMVKRHLKIPGEDTLRPGGTLAKRDAAPRGASTAGPNQPPVQGPRCRPTASRPAYSVVMVCTVENQGFSAPHRASSAHGLLCST